MDFAAIAAYPANGHAFSVNMNGHVNDIDLMKPVDFIEPGSKIVLNDRNTMDLNASVAYALHAAADFPNAATVVTQAHVSAAWDRIGLLVTMHTTFCALAAVGVNVRLRQSDTISSASWLDHPNQANTDAMAKTIAQYIHDFPEAKADLVSNSKFCLLALVACAIHRESCDGHNWYTQHTRDLNTLTGRMCAVAAADKRAFADFMFAHGHDLWHCIADDDLKRVADVITGHASARPVGAFDYAGVDRVGVPIHEWLGLGEAAMDRWPVGALGKSTIAVGLDELKSMLVSIVAKIAIDSVGDLINEIDALKAAIVAVATTRQQVIAVKEMIGSSIAIAHGYVHANIAGMANRRVHPAIQKFAQSRIPDKELGATLWKAVDGVEADRAALGALISSTLQTMAAALANGRRAAGAAADPVAIGNVEIPPPHDEVQAAERAAQMDQILGMVAAGRAP